MPMYRLFSVVALCCTAFTALAEEAPAPTEQSTPAVTSEPVAPAPESLAPPQESAPSQESPVAPEGTTEAPAVAPDAPAAAPEAPAAAPEAPATAPEAPAAAPEAPATAPEQPAETLPPGRLAVPPPDAQQQRTDIRVPQKGMFMNQVEAQFGAPIEKLPAVGKPPITRWIYADYTVYFEYKEVIHSVLNQRPVNP